MAETGIPNFANFEEAIAYAEKMKGGPKKNPLTSEKKSATKKPSPDQSKKSKVEEIDEDLVFQSIHFYTRKGDTWVSTQKDAREERDVRNVNVLIMAHDHTFKEACSDGGHCRRLGYGSKAEDD